MKTSVQKLFAFVFFCSLLLFVYPSILTSAQGITPRNIAGSRANQKIPNTGETKQTQQRIHAVRRSNVEYPQITATDKGIGEQNSKGLPINAPTTSQTWLTTLGGSGDDRAYAVVETDDGGYVAAGYTNSFGAGNTDIWVFKLSSSGNIVWQKVYGGLYEDDAWSITKSSDGGYLVAGLASIDNEGPWVLKLNGTGDIVWQKTYGGTANGWANTIVPASNGGYVIAGQTPYSGIGSQAWVMKIGEDGSVLWTQTYPGLGGDGAASIAQSGDGGYLLWGNSNGVASIVKLDPSGGIEWSKSYSSNGWISSVSPTLDGGYIVGSSYYLSGASSSDAWIFKLDGSGNVSWQKTFGDVSYMVSSIFQISNGGYIVAGRTFSNGGGTYLLKIDNSGSEVWLKNYPGFYIWHSIKPTSDGGYVLAGDNNDAMVLKVDASGNTGSACVISVNATGTGVTTTAVTQTLSVTASATTITSTNSNATVTETNAQVVTQCSSTDAIVSEARKDIGMPYDSNRGCQTPYTGCAGPYHGFYKGVCTDLALDAYNAAISFDFHDAILQDHLANPDHYYRHNGLARNADDMWNYFSYTGQILSNDQPYQPGDIGFFNWDGGEIDHVNIISQVDANGQPQYVVDAGGANAAEYPWNYYAPYVRGHGRLGSSGGLSARHSSSTQPFQVLRVTVDSPSVSLALQDANGKFTSSNFNENLVASNVEAFIPYAPAGEYANLGASKVISVTYPLSNTTQYHVQVTGNASTQYNLTVQTLQDGNVTASQTFPKSITSGQTHGTNLQLSTPSGVITFVASNPVPQPNLATSPSEIAVNGQTGLLAQAIFAVNETSGQQSASNISLSVSNLTDQFGNKVAGTLFTSTPSSFNLAAGGGQNVQLSINLVNIPTGTYLGRLLITTSNGSPQSVPLTLGVEAASTTATSTNTRTATPTLTRTATSTPTRTPTQTSTLTRTVTTTPTTTATFTPSATPTLACTAKPAKPVLVKPKNGGTAKKLKLLLDWNDTNCANTYTVIVREGSRTGLKVQTRKNLTLSQFKTKTLISGKTYYWRVTASNAIGSTKSKWWSFTVQ